MLVTLTTLYWSTSDDEGFYQRLPDNIIQYLSYIIIIILNDIIRKINKRQTILNVVVYKSTNS